MKKRYVVDERGNPVAVQLDIETFKKIEELLEDHALFKAVEEVHDEESLDLEEAKTRYERLLKESG